MDKAAYRIQKAINDKEKILLYGDYDVDGITSVANLYLFLNRFNEYRSLHTRSLFRKSLVLANNL